MSAREIIENLWDRAIPIGPLLDQYAHELAEKIRKEAGPNCLLPGEMEIPLSMAIVSAMHGAADLIDPETEN